MGAMNHFRRRDGTPTVYFFLCGYVDSFIGSTGKLVQMYMEHSHYHVKHISEAGDTLEWDVFERSEFGEARDRFNHYKTLK